MRHNHRGQFGSSSFLALLALGAGTAVAESLPPLRINSLLLGSDTQKLPAALSVVAPSAPAASPAPPPAAVPAAVAPVPIAPVQTPPAAPGAIQPSVATPVTAPAVKSVMEPVAAFTLRENEAQATSALAPRSEPSRDPLALPEVWIKSTQALEAHAELVGESLPSFIAADRIEGRNNVEMIAEGNVEVRTRNSILQADKLTQWSASGEMEAVGNVRLSRDSDRISGPKMRMKSADSTGFFEQPEYSIRRDRTDASPLLWTGDVASSPTTKLTTGSGRAALMEFEGDGKYRLTDATYSTCTPESGKNPDWFARTTDLRLDYEDQTGTARNATMIFKGVPILYSPWLTFPLNNQRKTGLLTPTIGSTTRGGQEVTQPVYWNIAPNMDATLSPRVMSKRGTLWNGEFRYLEHSFSGVLEGQYLPTDRIQNKTRSSYSISHIQNLGAGFTGTLDLKDVSDATFFSDLSNSSTVVAQTNLLRQGTIAYSGGWWSANLLAQSYKTLQDPSLPFVVEPYRRLPQLTVKATRGDLPLGLEFSFTGESVNFRHASQVEGRRLTYYPQLALPLQSNAFFLTPKVGVNSTRYAVNRQAAGTPSQFSRHVPILSVDSGVTFERSTDLFDSPLTQTLEPRLYYVKIPARDQEQIPVFDTGLASFDFAQIFSENRYTGGDRIGDADQVTAIITSRLLDPTDGSEVVRGAFGQRVYFGGQNVTLPGEIVRKDKQTDFLANFSGRVLPKTYLDSAAQYSPRFKRTERLNFGVRYQPESAKVVNVGYRYTRDVLGQLDLSGQWPLFGGWHTVGRINFSTKDGRMIESIAGLEYSGSCWVSRVVLQRIATQADKVNTAIFLQLELGDFARIGSSPIDLLKRNVPGYGIINQ